MRERDGWRSERAALVALVRDGVTLKDRAEAVSRADLLRLAVLATQHRVGSRVLARLDELGVVMPAEGRQGLERIRLGSAALKLHAEHTAVVLASILRVPFVVFKGPVLDLDWYGEPSMRDYGDLDVLVRRSDFCEAIEAVEKVGGRALLANWHAWSEERVGEAPVDLRGCTIDLHWSLTALGRVRSEFDMPEAEMLDRSVPSSMAAPDGTAIRTFDPEDTLLHLCLNTGLDGGRRLQSLLDVDVVIRTGRVDLERFAEQALSAGVGRLAAGVLGRSHRLLGTPVEATFLRELADGTTWLTLNRMVDEHLLFARATSMGPGMLLGAGRRSMTTTLRSVAENSVASVARRRGTPGPTSPDGRLNWNREPPDGNTAVHRRAYLDWVASGSES